jgi:MFS family permease
MTGSRKSTALVPALGLCAGGILLVLGVLAQETVWIVTLLALALAAVGATEAPVWTMAVELGRRHGGTAAAICNTGGNGGGLLAPIITPFVGGWVSRQFAVSDQIGWQWAIGLGSGIAVLGAVLWCWITPHDERSNASVP